MPTLNIEFNGTQTDLDDFCKVYNYQETVPNPDPQPAEGEEGHDTWEATITNPETKVNFFKRKVKEFVWESVRAQRIQNKVEITRSEEIAKTINF